VTSTIRRDNWLGFKSLWLGFRISAYGQGFDQVLGLVVQCLELGLSLQFTFLCKQEAANCLPALKPLQHLSMHVRLSCFVTDVTVNYVGHAFQICHVTTAASCV